MVAIDNAIIINCVSVIPIMLVGFVFFMCGKEHWLLKEA